MKLLLLLCRFLPALYLLGFTLHSLISSVSSGGVDRECMMIYQELSSHRATFL